MLFSRPILPETAPFRRDRNVKLNITFISYHQIRHSHTVRVGVVGGGVGTAGFGAIRPTYITRFEYIRLENTYT